jgi:hypothetical protein
MADRRSGKPRPLDEAPPYGRRVLGAQLRQRRMELGYTHRPAFARDKLPLTPSGNLNTRLLADIEEAYRADFPAARLRQLADAYQVDYQSLVDVAYRSAEALTAASPAPPPAVPPPAAVPDLTPPMDPVRAASDRPWFDEINERRVALAARGVTAPAGAQMFPDRPDDAKAWDGIGARLDIGARVWFIADLRRRAAGRAGNSGTGVTGA